MCRVDATIWTIAGQAVSLLGVFFLSVEAIKLDNLAMLRDRVIPRFRLAFESPLVKFPGETSAVSHGERNLGRGFGGRSLLYYGFHLIIPFGLLMIVESIRRHQGWGTEDWIWVALWQWQSFWKWVILAVAAYMLLGLLPYTIGCWLHKGIVRAADGLIWGLREIEKRTPTGGIGILGFLVTMIGVAAQVIGTVIGYTE